METSTIITTIVSSSVIATVLSSIINLYLKRLDFRNEYFKTVIQKRLAAYEWLESQIAQLKTSVLDNDGKAYHSIFGYGRERFMEFRADTMLMNSQNLWINRKTNDIYTELLHIINRIPFEIDIDDEDQLISSGKRYYTDIAHIRDRLENNVRKDVLTLYNFKDIKTKDSRPKTMQQINISPHRYNTNRGA